MSRGAASNGAGAKDAGALAVRFGRGIQRSITAFLVAVIALPLVSLWATYQIRTLSARVVAIEESRLQMSRALRYAVDEETALQAYLATGHRGFLAPYYSTHGGMGRIMQQLPQNFRAARLPQAVPLLRDFVETYGRWHGSVAEPLLANPYRANSMVLQAAGNRLMDRMRADSSRIHSMGIVAVAYTTRMMADAITGALAAAIAWVLLVALLTIIAQRRAVVHESRLLERIVREREEVRHLSDWRARLLAMLAHDFKSQLAVLIGGSHLLEDFPERRGDLELLASLRSASYALAEMADNAILLARAQERKIVLQRTTINLADLLQAVTQRYGGEREFNVASNVPDAAIDGDRSYVTRVMDNIIGNAVKYSDKPVKIAVKEDAAFICVSVCDRGIGISEADLPHIFEEFWRSERTRWKRNGSGVGLFIVKTIMEAHGGEISVESVLNYGTTVTLKFPRALTSLLAPAFP